MSRYLEILAMQRPFELPNDETDRVVWSMNFAVTTDGPAPTLEDDIGTLLVSAGLAVLGTDTFIGLKAQLPTGDGPYAQILSPSSSSPSETHDGNRYDHPTIQILVRAKDFDPSRLRALSIYNALYGLRNVTV